jgi:hypothetical protein
MPKVSENVRRLSRDTGLSQAIVKRFEKINPETKALNLAVYQHCDPEGIGACQCPVCGGAPRVCLDMNGMPMKSPVSQGSRPEAHSRFGSLLHSLGANSAVLALRDRSQRDPH